MPLALLVGPAAASAEDLLPPQIIHEPCDAYQTGKPFTVRAQFYDDSALFDPKVVFRTRRVTEWRSTPFKKGEGADFEATIKARDLKGPLEYFIETFDENGNGPARYGSPEAPVRVLPSSEEQECQQTGALLGPLKTYDTSKPEPPRKPQKPQPAQGPGHQAPPSATTQTPKSTDTPRSPPPAAGQHGGVLDISEPPQPAKEGCAADDPPAYCSPWLWVGLSAGLLAAGGAGFGIWWALEGQGGGGLPPVERVNLQIGNTSSPTGAIP